MRAPLICYHGGPPGLRVGQRILPASVTGAASTADYGAHGVCDPGKVYVTPDKCAAAIWAAMHSSLDGQVYKVRPVGEVKHDPDCREANLSYFCDEAVIVGKVKLKRKDLARIRKIFMGAG